ncbi:MAG: Ldh family oxidoreductase [Proteobacteria bacterium]|nr:Ldh family oxidoreductase [Pseudomonadota bacterium]
MKIKISELEDLTARALKQNGYANHEIPLIKGALLYAQLRGNNQGVVKLIGKGMPKDLQAGDIIVEKESPLSARLNGNKNHAMLVMNKAVGIVLEKVKQLGFAMVGTFNTNTSSGAIGHYTSAIAENGYIAFAFARSPERVAFHGSYEPVFGTDPLSIAIPSKPFPIVFDMSTAAISFYGLVEAQTAGQSIPHDMAYDEKGQPTTDPGQGIKGAIRSFDRSYKGSGLAMMAEILAGPLVGAAFCGIGDSKNNWGHLIFAINPDLLGSKDTFIEHVLQIKEKIKSGKKLEGVSDIFLPGERGSKKAQACLESGEIDLEDNLYHQLKKAAAL